MYKLQPVVHYLQVVWPRNTRGRIQKTLSQKIKHNQNQIYLRILCRVWAKWFDKRAKSWIRFCLNKSYPSYSLNGDEFYCQSIILNWRSGVYASLTYRVIYIYSFVEKPYGFDLNVFFTGIYNFRSLCAVGQKTLTRVQIRLFIWTVQLTMFFRSFCLLWINTLYSVPCWAPRWHFVSACASSSSVCYLRITLLKLFLLWC